MYWKKLTIKIRKLLIGGRYLRVLMVKVIIIAPLIGNCDIDFLNFRHCQVQNLKILNLFERNQNFGVIFQKYQKQN